MSKFRDLLFKKPSQVSPLVRAPKYLEYINQGGASSAGAKIVYTDYYVSGATEFETIVNINSTQATTISNLFGNDAGKLKLSYDATNQAIQLVVNDYTSSWISFTPDAKHTIKYIKEADGSYTNAIYIDGTRVEQATVTSWSDSGLAEEALTILGVGSSVANFNLYNFKVWYNDGTNRFLQHNYIPIIDYKNVLCMYDTEYEEHLYAQGVNSTLTASTNQYTQVEYLDWTGTTPIECEFYNPKSTGGNYGEPIHFKLETIVIPTKDASNKNIGGFKTFSNSRFRVVYNVYGQNYYMGADGSAVVVPADVKNQISYVFDMVDTSPFKQALYVNGEERTSSVPTTKFPGYGNWFLNFSNSSFIYKGEIYQYKITDYSHDAIFDYRSCKNQGGVAGVFNIYSATFIDCSASAVAGPDKQIPATQDFLFKKTQDDLYIDTTLPLYYPELKLRVKNYDNNNNINIGSYDNSSALQIYTDSLGVGTGTTTQYLPTSERSDVVLDGLNGKLFINDIEVTGSFSVVSSNVSPYIFKINGNTLSSANRGYVMFGEVKNNGITIRKLIPSYNPNDITKVGLYDPIRDEYMEASDASFDKFEVNGTPNIPRSVKIN